MRNLIFNLFRGVVILLFFQIEVFSQTTPYGLRLENVQMEIVENLSEYDSAIFADISSFWFNDDRRTQGLGYKGKDSYWLEVILEKDTSSFYDIKVKKLKSKKLKEVKSYNLDSLQNIPKDSLSIKTRTGVYRSISDANEWTLLIFNHKKITILRSYNPEYFQPLVRTKERELFMRIVNKLNNSKSRDFK